MITFQIGLTGQKEISTWLQNKENTIKHMIPVLSKVAIQMQRNVLQNFDNQGGPKGKWKELSDFTLFVRKYRKSAPTTSELILKDHGDLRMSTFPTVIDSDKYGEARITTTSPHAKLMNDGGYSKKSTVTIRNPRYNPQGIYSDKQGEFTGIYGGRYRRGKKEYDLNIKSHKIPARSFMVISQETKDKILNLIQGYIKSNGK